MRMPITFTRVKEDFLAFQLWMLEGMAQNFPLFLVIPFDFPHGLHGCRKETPHIIMAPDGIRCGVSAFPVGT